MENDINRYIHTYIEYLLNRLYKVVPNNQKDFVEKDLIEKNNYRATQVGRIISDNYPNIDFSIFQILENFRRLKEIYIKKEFGGNLPHFKELKQEMPDSKQAVLKSNNLIENRRNNSKTI